MVNMLVGECTQGTCPEFFRDANEVAKIVEKQNRVTTIDCAHQGAVCAALPKFKDNNHQVSLYIRERTIYGFEGNQDKEGLLEYFSEDNWRESHVIEGDFQYFYEAISGEKMTKMEKFWKKYNQLDSKANDYASKSFKKMPYLDRWSTNAKIIVITMATIPPLLLTIFWIISYVGVTRHNFEVDEKYRKQNEQAQAQKKN